MHSIYELKRQLQAATDRLNEAQKSYGNAKNALASAKMDATGLRDMIVEYDHKTWRSRDVTKRRFVAKQIGRYSDDAVRGPNVKNDGTLGQIEYGCDIDKLRVIGPYQP